MVNIVDVRVTGDGEMEEEDAAAVSAAAKRNG